MKFLRQIHDDTPRSLAREQIRRLIAAGGYRRGDQLPTYAELCDRLGVSLLTVQRAMGDLARQGLVYRLHGKGCYVGKALSGGPRPLSQVGLVFNASIHRLLQEPYLNLMLTGILDACSQENIDLTILSLRTAQGRIPPAQLAAQVDAIILISVAREDYVRQLAETQTPLVIVDNLFPNIAADTVVLDNAAALRQTMQHLLDLGHRRIAYVAGGTTDPFTNTLTDSSDAQERQAEYLAQMRSAGLSREIRIVEYRASQWDDAVAAAKGPDAPTAFVVYSAPQAISFSRQLEAAGLRVPGDVSVVGDLGSFKDAETAGMGLTFCRADFYSMGSTAVAMLRKRCRESRPSKPVIRRIPVEFVAGDSTAAPRA